MPTGNKTCNERYVKQCQDHHKRQLATVRSTIDNAAPRTLGSGHLKANAKKQQIMEDRYAQIERDNRILLEKMSAIMRVKVGQSAMDAAEAQARYAKSLNRESRKRELQKITKENARILQAIQSSEPFYDHTRWEREARAHERYMKNICEFPVSLYQPGVPEVDDGLEESYQQADFEAVGMGGARMGVSQGSGRGYSAGRGGGMP